MIDISIIIVNYKVKDYIIACIDSIYQSIGDRITFEIIVVNNDSNDGSGEVIQVRYPQVIQLHNQHNIGFSKGVNQGAEIAKGDDCQLVPTRHPARRRSADRRDRDPELPRALQLPFR